MFLRARVSPNLEGFQVVELAPDKFQWFLNQNGFKEVYKSKIFKTFVVPWIWTVVMQIIMKGLSGKHGCLDSMSKDWLYMIYNIFTGRLNVVNLAED